VETRREDVRNRPTRDGYERDDDDDDDDDTK
jgi:hypothetical protein